MTFSLAAQMPIDYAAAKKSGLIRKPSSFISTICDDRGEELLYAGIPVSKVFKEVSGWFGLEEQPLCFIAVQFRATFDCFRSCFGDDA